LSRSNPSDAEMFGFVERLRRQHQNAGEDILDAGRSGLRRQEQGKGQSGRREHQDGFELVVAPRQSGRQKGHKIAAQRRARQPQPRRRARHAEIPRARCARRGCGESRRRQPHLGAVARRHQERLRNEQSSRDIGDSKRLGIVVFPRADIFQPVSVIFFSSRRRTTNADRSPFFTSYGQGPIYVLHCRRHVRALTYEIIFCDKVAAPSTTEEIERYLASRPRADAGLASRRGSFGLVLTPPVRGSRGSVRGRRSVADCAAPKACSSPPRPFSRSSPDRS